MKYAIAYDSFHLFQRVVGFRLHYIRTGIALTIKKFPSLSESSGFPTSRKTVSLSAMDDSSFHLFQRVVGFRPVDGVDPEDYYKLLVSISFRE